MHDGKKPERQKQQLTNWKQNDLGWVHKKQDFPACWNFQEKKQHLHGRARHILAGFTEWKRQMTRTTKNDNLQMGSRIKRGESVNMWMFGRVTEGKIQIKKNQPN